MLYGMITLYVDSKYFTQADIAVFRLRADPSQPGASLRIFRIKHGDWSFL